MSAKYEFISVTRLGSPSKKSVPFQPIMGLADGTTIAPFRKSVAMTRSSRVPSARMKVDSVMEATTGMLLRRTGTPQMGWRIIRSSQRHPAVARTDCDLGVYADVFVGAEAD